MGIGWNLIAVQSKCFFAATGEVSREVSDTSTGTFTYKGKGLNLRYLGSKDRITLPELYLLQFKN